MIPTPISEEANDIDHETSDQVSTELRRSTRVRSTPEWYGNPILEVMLLDHDEPTNYEEAKMSPDSVKWLEAIKSEMGSMYKNKVWTLVDLPDDRQAIENKWIFKRKTDVDSSVTIYKARLVAKRFFDKFKVLNTMRFSHLYRCLSLSESCYQLPHFTKTSKWMSTAFLNGFHKE